MIEKDEMSGDGFFSAFVASEIRDLESLYGKEVYGGHLSETFKEVFRKYLEARNAKFDLVSHLHRQKEWSLETFGPGERTAGVVDHIRKELKEIEVSPDISEWVDVIILAFDGAWRSGSTPEQTVAAIVAKQTRNEGRTWPDWRTMPSDKAIEHARSEEEQKVKEKEMSESKPNSGVSEDARRELEKFSTFYKKESGFNNSEWSTEFQRAFSSWFDEFKSSSETNKRKAEFISDASTWNLDVDQICSLIDVWNEADTDSDVEDVNDALRDMGFVLKKADGSIPNMKALDRSQIDSLVTMWEYNDDEDDQDVVDFNASLFSYMGEKPVEEKKEEEPIEVLAELIDRDDIEFLVDVWSSTDEDEDACAFNDAVRELGYIVVREGGFSRAPEKTEKSEEYSALAEMISVYFESLSNLINEKDKQKEKPRNIGLSHDQVKKIAEVYSKGYDDTNEAWYLGSLFSQWGLMVVKDERK